MWATSSRSRSTTSKISVCSSTNKASVNPPFVHIWFRGFTKCFESPPDIILHTFNCLLSIDRVTYANAWLAFVAYIFWSTAPSMTRFWLMRLLEPLSICICLAMLRLLCWWSGLWTRAIHESSMIGWYNGNDLDDDGNELVHAISKND